MSTHRSHANNHHEEDSSVSIHVDDNNNETSTLNPKSSSDSHGHGDHHDHSNCKGHDHSHGPGHGHGRGRGKGKKWYVEHGLSIKIFAYAMFFGVWAMNIFRLNEPLKGNAFDSLANNVYITFVVSMAIISYYKASTANNGNPTKAVPVHASSQNSVLCKNCNNWKPERTHHCSACNQCILKMDHHCPWIVNCVGYKNHKAFWLFCFYVALGGSYYSYRSISYLMSTIHDGSFYDFTLTFLIFWFFFSLVVCPFSLMVTGLTLYHYLFALNNTTTLENMGGANMKTPCDSKLTREMKIVNKYDRGMIANLYEFFGNTYFFWWWPSIVSTNYTGQSFDQISTPSPMEILDLLRGNNSEESPEERIMKPRNLGEVDVENILKIAEEFTKDKHMQFLDRILEIGKRRDNTYRKPEEPVNNVQKGNGQAIQAVQNGQETIKKDSNSKDTNENQDNQEVTTTSKDESAQ